jgi:GDP-4-dehydro-6-deoxy-D-mannose reductase
MKVLVTGATGFVGRWLIRELAAHGHQPIEAPGRSSFDVTNPVSVARLVREAAPGAVVHLAGVSHAVDAARDPAHAVAVNEGGTRSLLSALAMVGSPPVLISGSSEVYGQPDPSDLPLREDAPTRPVQPYGQSKLAQERAAIEVGAALDIPVVVTRSFNHTGPGQRPEFVVPALAGRLLEAKRSGAREVAVGNLDVRRDFGDVRDTARAYRLLLEGLAAGAVRPGTIVNVATGRAVSIRGVLERLMDLIGVDVTPRPDPVLVRANDPPLIVGDPGRLRALTGWTPEIPLEVTLADLVASLESA